MCFLFLAALVFLIVSFFPVGEHLEVSLNTTTFSGVLFEQYGNNFVYSKTCLLATVYNSQGMMSFGECKTQSLNVIAVFTSYLLSPKHNLCPTITECLQIVDSDSMKQQLEEKYLDIK